MTKEEIKAMIAQKIEGQGTNLDAASVLPTILNWIIDNMGGAEIPAATKETIGGIKLGYAALGDAIDHKITPFGVGGVSTPGEDFARIGLKALHYYDSPSSLRGVTKEELTDYLSLTANPDLVDDVFNGAFAGIYIPYPDETYYYLPLSCCSTGKTVVFGNIDSDSFIGARLTINKQGEDSYDVQWGEI